MSKFKPVQEVAAEDLLSRADKEQAFAVLLRCEDVFLMFQNVLESRHFGKDHDLLAIWDIVKKFYAARGSLPSRTLLMTRYDRFVTNNRHALDEDEVSHGEEFIDLAFTRNAWSFNPKRPTEQAKTDAIAILKQFVEEALALSLKSSLIGDSRLYDVPAQIQEHLAEIEQVRTLGVPVAQRLFYEGWDVNAGLNITTTGVSFMNDMLGGGEAGGEVYAILGPMGSCKTTTAIMLAVEGAKAAMKLELDPEWDKVRRLSFLFSWEATTAELRLRLLAYATKTPRKYLQMLGKDGLSCLSTSANLRDYEKYRYRASLEKGETVPGEQERIKTAIPWIEKHLKIVDYSGADEHNPAAGGGFVEEVAQAIRATCEKCEVTAAPNRVVMDYAGAMVRRYLSAHNLPEKDHLRHRLMACGINCKNVIATRYNVPVYLYHQLSGQANERGPGAKLSHTDAAECKSFSENTDFTMVIGKPSNEGYFRLSQTKHRRTAPEQDKVLKLIGNFGNVQDSSKEMMIDSWGKIIKKEDAKVVDVDSVEKLLPQHSQGDAPGKSKQKKKKKPQKPKPPKTIPLGPTNEAFF